MHHSSIIVSHNHPSGNLNPSPEFDTYRYFDVLKPL